MYEGIGNQTFVHCLVQRGMTKHSFTTLSGMCGALWTYIGITRIIFQ